MIFKQELSPQNGRYIHHFFVFIWAEANIFLVSLDQVRLDYRLVEKCIMEQVANVRNDCINCDKSLTNHIKKAISEKNIDQEQCPESGKRHLRRPHFSKGLTKLAILPDYKCPGLTCLALPARQKFDLILVII